MKTNLKNVLHSEIKEILEKSDKRVVFDKTNIIPLFIHIYLFSENLIHFQSSLIFIVVTLLTFICLNLY